jgi:LacI family transcriptional regulator
MTITLNDIAKVVGVKTATVSRVLNDKPNPIKVSEATKNKIFQAAKDLGYQPNAAARAIRCGKFNRIACVVTQYGPRGTTYWPTMSGYLEIAADKLAEYGYSLIFEPFHIDYHTDQLLETPSLFTELAVDGILGVAAAGMVSSQVDDKLSSLKAPTVWLNRNPMSEAMFVTCNEAAGARELTRHLIGLGHRRIGYVGTQGDHHSKQDRYRGVMDEIAAGGLETFTATLKDRHACLDGVAAELLDRHPRPTALVCYGLFEYDAAIMEAARRGIKIPEQLSLCYFASPWDWRETQYKPTRVEIPEVRMTAAAVDILMARVREQKILPAPKPFMGKMVVGHTTVPPES